MRAVIAVAVLFLGGFFFFGIYWPKHQHQVAIDKAAAVVDKYRTNAVAREADLEAIVKTLGTLELHPASPPIPEPTTFALVMTGDLRQRAGLPPVASEPSLGDKVYLDQLMSLVETGKRFAYDKEKNDDARIAEEMMAPVASMRYALILDTTEYQAPNQRNDNTFTPGGWSAKAYFFDVPARKYIAGWMVYAQSSGSVGQGGIFQGSIALDADLEKRIMAAIATKIRENVNGIH